MLRTYTAVVPGQLVSLLPFRNSSTRWRRPQPV